MGLQAKKSQSSFSKNQKSQALDQFYDEPKHSDKCCTKHAA
jgi:hypothetical protein